MTNKTLAIIGSHPRTREAFDFSRTDVDVWLFNEAISNKTNVWAKRADVVFQMHVPAIWKNPKNRNDAGHYAWLQTVHDCAVYMQDVYPEIPASRRYPLENILQMIDNDPNHFLTSSVPQAMALAAYLDCYKRIEIYGVAMETNTEYQFQREGVAYWYGYLKGHGIDVYFADSTFHAPLYGYEGEVSIQYERFIERIGEVAEPHHQAEAAYSGAKSNLDLAVDRFIQDSSEKNEKELYQATVTVRVAAEQLGLLDGIIQTNEHYKKKADVMRESSGGEFVFSRQEFESTAKTNQDKLQRFMIEITSLGTTLEHIHHNIKQSAKGSPKRLKYAQMYSEQIANYLKLQNGVGIISGVVKENFNYMAYLDKHIRAAGGTKSEAVILEAMQNATMV